MKIHDMETIGLVIIILSASSLGDSSTGLDDGCTSAWSVLPNSSKREISYIGGSGETLLSDDLILEGWYTVATGYVLTNTDVNLHTGSCGTYFPIWLNGTYPTRKNEKVAVWACRETYFHSCEHLFEITIQCCGSHYVYYLKNTTVNSAYCLGTARSCNNGSSCSIVSGTMTGTNCTNDVDECEIRQCEHNSTCINFYGSYRCLCTSGWSGETCGLDVNECSFRPCQHNGTCINSHGSFTCWCADGWTGETCEQDMNECQNDPCKNRGTCVNTNGSYYCTCQEGFAGADCLSDIDECKSRKCERGGVCINSYGSYICSCTEGWTGEICEKETSEQHTGINRTPESYIPWILFGVLFLVDLILIIVQILQCRRRTNSRQSSKDDKSFDSERYGQGIQNYEQHSSSLARIDAEGHQYETLGDESTADSSRRYFNQNIK